jgi:hypothetical protein
MDNIVVIIPTGVGASIGGFAGDGGYVVRELAKKYRLIVNPNVVNAACFSSITDSMLYTEGYALNRFFKNEINLLPSTNKIGVIFDKAIPKGVLNIHLNTLNAMKVVYGITDIEYEITSKKVGVEFNITSSNISGGNVNNTDTLFEAGKKLIKKGCNALAVVCLFEDDEEDEDYQSGKGVDIVGGVEAIISHVVSREFNIPVAHAPAFRKTSIIKKIVNPKSAAEYITPTFLPCIILGLYKAPQFINSKEKHKNAISIFDIKKLVMPYNALGCIPVFKALEYNIPVFAIKENSTVLNVTKEKLGLKNIIEVKRYFDI